MVFRGLPGRHPIESWRGSTPHLLHVAARDRVLHRADRGRAPSSCLRDPLIDWMREVDRIMPGKSKLPVTTILALTPSAAALASVVTAILANSARGRHDGGKRARACRKNCCSCTSRAVLLERFFHRGEVIDVGDARWIDRRAHQRHGGELGRSLRPRGADGNRQGQRDDNPVTGGVDHCVPSRLDRFFVCGATNHSERQRLNRTSIQSHGFGWSPR